MKFPVQLLKEFPKETSTGIDTETSIEIRDGIRKGIPDRTRRGISRGKIYQSNC